MRRREADVGSRIGVSTLGMRPVSEYPEAQQQARSRWAKFPAMECAAVREFTGTHNMIRGMFRLMEAAVSKAKPADAKQMKVLSELGLFGVEGTHFHHSVEDNYYWPAVERNGADASLLEPLVKEHRVIDPLLDEVQRAFEALKHGAPDAQTLESLKLLVGRFKDDMLSHLDHEEPIFFPLLTRYMPDHESHRLAAELAKKAPREGLSWLMGGVEYGMTKAQSTEFIATFPKPIQWMRPLLLRKYKNGCGVLGVDPATPSQR
jgi:hemerythrin-like domain-containing protein